MNRDVVLIIARLIADKGYPTTAVAICKATWNDPGLRTLVDVTRATHRFMELFNSIKPDDTWTVKFATCGYCYSLSARFWEWRFEEAVNRDKMRVWRDGGSIWMRRMNAMTVAWEIVNIYDGWELFEIHNEYTVKRSWKVCGCVTLKSGVIKIFIQPKEKKEKDTENLLIRLERLKAKV